MSTGDLMDDDPDVGAAVEKILARGASALGDEVREDRRENRDDREPHERAEDADLDVRSDPVEAKGKEQGEEPAEGDEQFLEIPGEDEEAEPLKVPLSEAAQAVKQIRQMQGDIAAAVVKAETEAQEKTDRIVAQQQRVYEAIAARARTAAQLMQQFLPQPPSDLLLDRSSEYFDPVAYYEQKAYYDQFVAHHDRVLATVKQAEAGKVAVLTEAEKAAIERENSRLARWIPEWGDEKTREAKRGEIQSALAAKYGVTSEDFEGVVSHKAWRMMNDLAGFVQTQAKAPEIKKTVQEKAAKLNNGKMPSREQGTGRFVSEARKELRETGSIDAAARLFMRSGLTKGL